MVDRSEANLKVLNEADEIQDKTKDAANRILRNVKETEELAIKTYEEQQRQGDQIDKINSDLSKVNSQLNQSSALQDKFDRWAGNWFGIKKSRAARDAAEQMNQIGAKETMHIKEAYENEKYDLISRTWSHAGMVLASDPKVKANELFNPTIQTADSAWSIDFTLTHIDAEGWTYAHDFNTLNNQNSIGSSSPQWNSYVRRRKWKFTEKKNSAIDVATEVRKRQDERKLQKNTSIKLQEKTGYIPRGQVTLTASGLASTNRSNSTNRDDQELDAESQRRLNELHLKDSEINSLVGEISKTVDNLGNIAKEMGNTAREQNKKLDHTDTAMQQVNEKALLANARLHHQIK